MGINLTRYCKDNKANEEDLGRLIAKLYQSHPALKYLAKTEHLSKRYATFKPEDVEIYTIASTILQRQFVSFLDCINLQLYRTTCIELFGCDPATESKEMAMKALLFSRATFFNYSNLGACSHRACYSSLILARAFPKIKVFVVSAPSKDQFVVQLKVAGKDWLVYDPLTNPDVLLPHEIYQREVLAKFPDADKPAIAFNMRVTKELSDEYFNRWPQILEKIQAIFLETKPSSEKLIQDDSFIDLMRSYKIDLKRLPSKFQKALVVLQSLFTTVKPPTAGEKFEKKAEDSQKPL